MIFMSQSGLAVPEKEADWDEWYVEHLRVMRTVPGFFSAQRFKTKSPGHPPSLAMYGVASEQVFHDPYYLSVRGMGEFKALIDTRFYKRNLFAGADRAPPVAVDQILIVADRDRPDPGLPDMLWLEAVAIDRSTPFRGILAVPAADEKDWAGVGDLAIYRPVG